TIDDVERAAEKAGAAPAAPVADRAAEMRKSIAAAMSRSKREIPHYYLATDIPLARMTRWLAARNEGRAVTERVLLAAPLLKAVALGLKKFPELNGYYREGAFVPGPGIHLGVAISLRQGGLIAPAIRDVDKLPIDALMRQLADLVARARALTLKSSEMSDATVTVTNLGDNGVRLVEGVIYPPQVALVGFGRVTDRAWAEQGKVIVTPLVTASLSADHRASDGHRGALFLNEVDRLLQNPEELDGAFT
ncbi:MAG: 2-oxo acid dehydrogenase subunit E2, partial [Steroidobacteraceae bacterium]